MSDVEIEQKREEDERLDTAEDPNEEVRPKPLLAHGRHLSAAAHFHAQCARLGTDSLETRTDAAM